jgi:hypothetical protein
VYATLYLPDRLVKLQSQQKHRPDMPMSKIRWEPREVEGDDYDVVNPLGVVPVVPFRHRARMVGEGRSEIDGVTDTQDRINETLFDRMIAQKTSAFRQRFLTGFTPDFDETTGEAKRPFKPSATSLWWTTSEHARFGDFEQTDVTGMLSSVEADVKAIAAQKSVPPHYLLGEMVNLAAESLKAAEAALIASVRGITRGFDEPWEDVHGLCFRAVGNAEKAAVTDAEVIWRNPEFRTEGQLVDALTKMATLGVPQEALWERWGASPQEITRWKRMQTAQSARAAGADLEAFLAEPSGNGNKPTVEVS